MNTSNTKERVVVLHGILRSERSMSGLANFIQSHGYDVLNLGYPSTKLDLAALTAHVHNDAHAFVQNAPGKIHFIGYSMGGLLIRAYLHAHKLEALGRVVMLGTPNHGSEVADFIQRWKIYQKFYGPAGQQLITNQSAFASLFGNIDFELGVLAGTRSIDPISSWIIGKPNDGKVSVASTRIDGMKDHLTIRATHTFFPNNKTAWRQTLHFLKHGAFDRASVTP